MSKNFHEQFDRSELPLPPDRSTGLVFAAIAAIVAVLWRSDNSVLYPALAIAVGFALISLIIPIVLRPLNIVWMKFALLLNKVMNPVIMFLLFAVAIVPAGLIMQLRADPLRKRRNTKAVSHWIERQPDEKSNMRNQF